MKKIGLVLAFCCVTSGAHPGLSLPCVRDLAAAQRFAGRPDTFAIDEAAAERDTSTVVKALAHVDAPRIPNIKALHIRYLVRISGQDEFGGPRRRYELPDNTVIEISDRQRNALPENVRNWLLLSDP